MAQKEAEVLWQKKFLHYILNQTLLKSTPCWAAWVWLIVEVGLFPWLSHHYQLWYLHSLLCRDAVDSFPECSDQSINLPLKSVYCEWLFFHYFCMSLVWYFSSVNFCYIILIWSLTYFVEHPPPYGKCLGFTSHHKYYLIQGVYKSRVQNFFMMVLNIFRVIVAVFFLT
jgi:hypothetical protein